MTNWKVGDMCFYSEWNKHTNPTKYYWIIVSINRKRKTATLRCSFASSNVRTIPLSDLKKDGRIPSEY